MIIRVLYGWIFLSILTISAYAAQLTQISASHQAHNTRLYFTIKGAFTHKIFTLNQPNRVVVDLNATDLNFNLQQAGLVQGYIQKVRSGSPQPGTLRLVFDVAQPVTLSSAPWHSGSDLNGIRLDFLGAGAALAPQARATQPANHTKKADALIHQASSYLQINHQQPVHQAHNPPKRLKEVVVVLDAGHGGKDPGAKGPSHSQEKNVVLAITLKLKQLIDRQPGMRAVLTRSRDNYVGLRERLDIARKYNGDIFVSIHADAFNNPNSSGASVFALSQGGATSEAARWIAEKENYSELGGVNLGDLDDDNGIVRSVLIDLSQTATINSSLQIGGRVLGQLGNFTRLHNSKVEQARFMVLKSPDMPSILVETGFISNPVEERNLTNSAYQTRLSQAIFQGIKAYFWSNPPQGTRIEAMVSK